MPDQEIPEGYIRVDFTDDEVDSMADDLNHAFVHLQELPELIPGILEDVHAMHPLFPLTLQCSIQHLVDVQIQALERIITSCEVDGHHLESQDFKDELKKFTDFKESFEHA